MDLAANSLELLKSKTALTCGFVALLIGFVCGILVSRWQRRSKRITRLVELENEFLRLDEELERIVVVADRIWEKAKPASRANTQTLQPRSYQAHKQSWIKSLYRRTLGKIVKKVTKRKKGKPRDATSRLAASVLRLKSQTDKISRAESLLPSLTKDSPTILRKNDADKGINSFDNQDDFGLTDAGSTYVHWQKEKESRTTGAPEDSFQRSVEYPPITQDELLELYNHAVTDNFAREEFRERYQPIRLGTVNAVERRQNPTAVISPEFRETTDGDFFAFPSGATTYRVVPRLGLTVGAVSYNAGALGEMFGNPCYDAAQSYSHYQVQQAAIFKRDGEKWELIEPGRLDLGVPD